MARAGKPILQRSYGLADAESKTADTIDTKFPIGSITKQFTAAAILLLQERGRLSLNDPIRKYLTNAPASWSRVTIRHLLTHTSGLPNITAFPDYADIRTRAASPDELIARISAKPLEYEPGTKYTYGNSDYIVLGRLIEMVSGQSYGAFLKGQIFDPLHMNATGVDDERIVVPRRATGYAVDLDGIRHADAISMTVLFSAGNLHSTVGDLFKWETALFAGNVISPASLKMMTTPYRNGYGLGLFVGEQDGHRFVSHTGDIDGFGGMLAYYPDDKLTVIVLSNLFGGAYGLVAKDIARTAFGVPFVLPGERKSVVVPPSVLADYAGVYQLTPSVRNLISLKNGRLTSKIGNQAELEMVPESQTRFFFRAGEAEIEFVRDAATGKVCGLIVHQDGAAFNGVKTG
ncbi:MAG: serine hydrolase [Sphingomonas sp.]|uniref:serine hydrolase n=1 Tax=Sphingomonas sp. TaxID=28214 RepID=UPI0012280103|nr:serine hydrolase [Sphingomonas sp.]THD37506.1 MAG: serine hydrolase [Sphingomonas sp.]